MFVLVHPVCNSDALYLGIYAGVGNGSYILVLSFMPCIKITLSDEAEISSIISIKKVRSSKNVVLKEIEFKHGPPPKKNQAWFCYNFLSRQNGNFVPKNSVIFVDATNFVFEKDQREHY